MVSLDKRSSFFKRSFCKFYNIDPTPYGSKTKWAGSLFYDNFEGKFNKSQSI